MLVIGEEGDVARVENVHPARGRLRSPTPDLDLVIADVYADLELGPARGDVSKGFRDSELSRTISTVDDLDLAQGPLTVMLALSDLTCVPPVVGHYGYGPDSRRCRLHETACRGLVTSATPR